MKPERSEAQLNAEAHHRSRVRPRNVQPARIEDVVERLDQISKLVDHLKGELRWVHSISYGRNPAPSTAMAVRTNQPPDPTGSLVVNQEKIRSEYRRAVSFIPGIERLLQSTFGAIANAIESADRSEDLRLLPREYDQPRKEVNVVSKKEREEAEGYQEQRAASGKGFGES